MKKVKSSPENHKTQDKEKRNRKSSIDQIVSCQLYNENKTGKKKEHKEIVDPDR
jgi:hypothetical protein